MDSLGNPLCLFAVFAFIGVVSGQSDPCNTYMEINDTSMTLAYTLGLADKPICDALTPDWYRFVASTEGVMATACPSGTECGTEQQVWMEGVIPSYYNGTSYVDICIRGNGDCCDRHNRIEVKNCNSYLVYYLVLLPPCSRYCFNESSDVLITVSTTSTTTTSSASTASTILVANVTTVITNTSNAGGSTQGGTSIAVVAGIVIGSLVTSIALVALALFLYFYKLRTPMVKQDPSNVHWNKYSGSTDLKQ